LALLVALGLAACAPRTVETATAEHPTIPDDQHPGKQVFGEWCASCHENNNQQTGAPTLAALRTLNRSTVKYTLELGYMQQEAKNVPKEELAQLIDWLPSADSTNDDWVDKARCPIKMQKVRLENAPRTAMTFGVTNDANRRQSAEQAGLSKADMKNLEVAWVTAFPQTPTMRSQPVIVGDTIFIAATDAGRLYALDTNTGCVKWHYVSDMTLRSSLTFADKTDKSPARILLGDAAGRVHAVDAETGKEAWVTDVKLTALNRITGAPVVQDGVVFAPVSVIESNFPPNDEYECCKGQGAVVALDLATGEKKWVGRTIDEDAKPTRKGRSGTQQYGPAGAMVWSTPVIDKKRGQLYAGTGESLSWPATGTSDSIIAYDLKTGAKRWVFQAAQNDIWNSACGRRGANCDWPGEYWSPDFDFGGTSMLITRKDGSEMVIAGQKAGVIWALNPDTGALQWSNKISRGSAMGGVHWGMSYDDKNGLIFAPSNDSAGSPDNPNWGPGIHALDAMTGEIQWSYKPNARDCGADLPVAKAAKPAPEWRSTPIAAPMLPPKRPATPPARRPPAAAAARAPAAPPPAPALPPAAATPAPEGAPPAAIAARPAGGEGGAPRARCRLGFSPAPLLVDGALVTGTPQGMLRIFDGVTGDVLFEYMTNRPYAKTVSGVPGQGGGLDSAPYIAGDGTLFVQSGYARFGEPPGNVLIAFRPKTKH
jgi:polyvinyl alcohol dehydrogenase (cytochrome)